MQFQIDRARLKAMTRTLQTAVAETPKQRFRYTQALDALARAFGYADWNTAEADLPETAADPAPAPAAGTLPDRCLVLRMTSEYTTDMTVCLDLDTAVAEVVRDIQDAGGSAAPRAVARALADTGFYDTPTTRYELDGAGVVGDTAPVTDLAADLLAALTPRLDTGLPPAGAPAGTRDLAGSLARALARVRPDRADVLDSELAQHPGYWTLDPDVRPNAPVAIRDADNQLVAYCAAGDAGVREAAALTALANARAARLRTDEVARAGELLAAYRDSGGDDDELFTLLNLTAPPSTREPVAASAFGDAASQLEIEGPESALAELIEQLGLHRAAKALTDAAWRHRGDPETIGAERRIMAPVAAGLADQLRDAMPDEEQLWHGLMDLVDDAFGHLAATAANAAGGDDDADAAVDRVMAGASEVNNDGVPGQVAFLAAFHEPARLTEVLWRAIAGQKPYTLSFPRQR